MKKYLYKILFLSLLLLVSCYADKGNYNYDPEFMRIEGFESAYTVIFDQKLVISPKVYPQSDDYEYTWGVYKELIVEQSIPVLDTIWREKDLDWKCNIPASNYPLVFIVRNKKTNVSKTVYAPLSIRTESTLGWWVLKDYAGRTDLDMFHARGKIENFISAYNNSIDLKGEAVGLIFTGIFQKAPGVYTTAMFVASKNDMSIIDINGGLILKGMDDLFYEQPEVIDVYSTFGNQSTWYVFNNGKVHSMNIQDKFIVPIPGDFMLSKKYVFSGLKSMFFDEKSKSFLNSDEQFKKYADDQWGEPISMSPSNTGKDLVSFVKIPGDRGATYALMTYSEKDKESGESVEKGLFMELMLGIDASVNPIRDESLTVLPDKNGNGKLIWKADNWAGNANDNVIMFHYNGKIYTFNPYTHEEKEVLTLKSDEQLTYMEHIMYEPFDGEESESINCFVIATKTANDGYRVYKHKIILGGLSIEKEPFLTGTGKVAKIMYTTDWGSNTAY